MQLFKKILIFLFILLSSYSFISASDADVIKNGLLQKNTILTGVESAPSAGDLTVVDSIFIFVKNTISALLLVIIIGVFLFMGIRLVLARGNPEELKKTMLQFVYVAIGIFIISIAWAIVKLVSSLNI